MSAAAMGDRVPLTASQRPFCQVRVRVCIVHTIAKRGLYHDKNARHAAFQQINQRNWRTALILAAPCPLHLSRCGMQPWHKYTTCARALCDHDADWRCGHTDEPCPQLLMACACHVHSAIAIASQPPITNAGGA